MKQRGRRGLSILLTLCLLLGLSAGLAVPAGAATADWAQSAVDTLNGIYGSNVFSADDAEMTVSDAQSVLNALNNSTDVLDGQSSFTRGLACEVLADIFALPIGNQTAIQYLYNENIINGESSGNLNPDGPVSKAQFAVLTYRVLNAVGGGLGSDIEGLTPGTDEYYAWLYLAVRKSVPFEQSDRDSTQIGSATISTYNGSSLKEGYTDIYDVTVVEKSGRAIWDAWEDAMQDPNLGGVSGFMASDYSETDTLLAAATKMFKQFMDYRYSGTRVIFYDVLADNWYYDGIMYLADRQIIIGYGDGQFGPYDPVERRQLAVMLYRYETETPNVGENELSEAIRYVTDEGYMTPPEDESVAAGWWLEPATRGETVTAIIKACAEPSDLNQVNTQVLDRFSDTGGLSGDTAKCAAYAVSLGILNGNRDGTLGLDSNATRSEAGVLFYRTLIGVDKTKMQDYRESVEYVLPADTGTAGTVSEPTGAEGGN